MRLQATAIYKPRASSGQYIEAHITPAVRASVEAATRMVQTTAKALCPVDTGELQASITTDIEETGKTIIGRVGPHTHYAAFVEFGTGIAGAGSAGAGEGPYNLAWPGQVAQPYMRPAIDEARGPVMSLFRSNISVGLR